MLGDDVDGPAVNGRVIDRVAALVELLQPTEFRGMKIGGVDLRELQGKNTNRRSHVMPSTRMRQRNSPF